MKDSFLKSSELLFRRLLIYLLRFVIKRKKLSQGGIDYNSSKFLFIRQDRIGDVLISTPIFASIKKHYPGAVLDVLLSINNCFVLNNDPLIRKRWIYNKNISDSIKLIKSIRNERYDYLIDMTDNSSATSTLLCLLSGAKWNIGIDKENSYIYDIVVPMLSRKETHIVNRISNLLIPFQIDPNNEKLKIRYHTSIEADKFAEQFIHKNGLDNRRLIAVNISAGGKSRFWGIENYRNFLLSITKNHPSFSIIVLFRPNDIKKAKMVVGSNDYVYLSPVTDTFDQFAALIKCSSVLVSPDTSAVHLASAFQIPSVVLYVQSNNNLRIWEPYDVECETIVTEIDDLSLIPLNTVIIAFERLLKRIELQ